MDLVTSTNRHRDDIDAGLDALDRLTAGLADDTEVIASSIKKLDPAIRTLQGHEDKAVELLAALDRIEGSSRKTRRGHARPPAQSAGGHPDARGRRHR